MAKYVITYACGHSEEINLYGTSKDREKRIAYLSKFDCPKCKAESARQEALGKGYPDLIGSERQIIWADQLRGKFILDAENIIGELDQEWNDFCKAHQDQVSDQAKTYNQRRAILTEAADRILFKYNRASWWIDHRYDGSQAILKDVIDEILKEQDAQASSLSNNIDEDVVAKAEATTYPENQQHYGVVEISMDDKIVSARYERNDIFAHLVKSLGYRWDRDRRAWIRKIDKFSGCLSDRAAELGNALLRAGFAIMIFDDETRNKAICANYALEQKRWIKAISAGPYKGWLAICFPRGEQNTYDAARKIPGSRWVSPRVVVPLTSFDCVEDFADNMGFKFSTAALTLINTYKANRFAPVSPSNPAKELSLDDKLSEILNSSADILDDLKDD